MKDCKKIHPLLTLYLDGGLTPREAGRVEAHLKGCADAQKELEALKRLRGVLVGLPEPKIPSDLHDKIMARLRGGSQPLPAPRRLWVIPTWTLAAAAVLVAFFINQYPNWREQLMAPPAPPSKVETKAPNPFPAANENKDVNQVSRPAESEAPRKKEAKTVSHRLEKRKEEALKPGDTTSTRGLTKQAEAPVAAKARLDMVSASNTSTAANVPTGGAAESGAGVAMQTETSAAPPAPRAQSAPPAPAAPSVQEGFNSVTYSREMSVLSWSGNNGPSTVEQAEAVTNAQVFQQLWQAVYPNQPLPTVDFTKQAVVVLMAGQEPSSGYSIKVSRLEEKADQLVIHYRVAAPSANTVANTLLTSPWAMQVIEKPSKPVVFQKDP